MSKKEIKITEYVLEDCKGNLRTLSANWQQVPIIPANTINKSKGNAARSVKSGIESTHQVDRAFQDLLDNSIAFFAKAGITYEESDETASQHIDTITSG